MAWFMRGLKQGVKTIDDPASDAVSRALSPGRPLPTAAGGTDYVALCPTGALTTTDGVTVPEYARCVHCLRCVRASSPIRWDPGYRWAVPLTAPLPHAFRHSIHVRVLDGGDCGACLSEVRQLSSPIYSLHRFGIYITPTPREADVLLVVGPATRAMRTAMLETYAAMPDPKRVIAMGTCALSGGVFASSAAVAGCISEVVPVDLQIPGCPPPPLAIVHGLHVVMGQDDPVPRGREGNTHVHV